MNHHSAFHILLAFPVMGFATTLPVELAFSSSSDITLGVEANPGIVNFGSGTFPDLFVSTSETVSAELDFNTIVSGTTLQSVNFLDGAFLIADRDYQLTGGSAALVDGSDLFFGVGATSLTATLESGTTYDLTGTLSLKMIAGTLLFPATPPLTEPILVDFSTFEPPIIANVTLTDSSIELDTDGNVVSTLIRFNNQRVFTGSGLLAGFNLDAASPATLELQPIPESSFAPALLGLLAALGTCRRR